LNWKLTDIETGIPGYFRRPDIIFERPKNFELMLEYSQKLSEDFVFVRVNLYNVNGIIYLGEMTFCPSNNGFRLKNTKQSIDLGKLINVNKIKKSLFNWYKDKILDKIDLNWIYIFWKQLIIFFSKTLIDNYFILINY